MRKDSRPSVGVESSDLIEPISDAQCALLLEFEARCGDRCALLLKFQAEASSPCRVNVLNDEVSGRGIVVHEVLFFGLGF